MTLHKYARIWGRDDLDGAVGGSEEQSLVRLPAAQEWKLKEKSKKPPKWDHKRNVHGEGSGNRSSRGKKLPLHSCRLDRSPAKHRAVGLGPLFEDKLDEEWRREQAGAHQAPMPLSITRADNKGVLGATDSASFLSAKSHAGCFLFFPFGKGIRPGRPGKHGSQSWSS